MRPLHSLRRSFQDFRRHPWLHGLSIVTIAISLLILGVFLVVYRNFVHLADHASPTPVGTAYLQEGLNELEINNLSDRILSMEGVRDVEFKTRKSVLEELANFYGDAAVDSGGVEGFFPNLLEVHLRDTVNENSLKRLSDQIASFPEVTQVDFARGWQSQFKRLKNVMSWIGLALMAGLLLGCSFIIANFMGMRHQSRRRDIEIIHLMGASRRYILMPFLWEGMLEGLMGVGVAVSALVVLNSVFLVPLAKQWGGMAGIDQFAFLSPAQIAYMVGIGLVMALIGSVTVFIRFRENH
ncbi:MAG: permease-like cell division protein FtsX [Bdellovibrionales bacterium]|nr:permease-like cell division protein FtsX [Bdellovibrionales bacterium]